MVKYVVVQRFYAEQQLQLFNQLYEIRKQNNFKFKFVYDIDDCIISSCLPKFNDCRQWFNNSTDGNMFSIMSRCDIITTSTEQLAEVLCNYFNLNDNRIEVIPNFISSDWIDYKNIFKHGFKKFDNEKNYKKRIGIIGGSSHFSNTQDDDYSMICDWIQSVDDKYDFVFFGGMPYKLKNKNKYEFHNTAVRFEDYPKSIMALNLDLSIACLEDIIFNRCKSNIKVIESWALNIPIITNNICTYDLNTMIFHDNKSLNNLVENITENKGFFDKIRSENQKRFLKSWTLDKRIKKYVELLKK